MWTLITRIHVLIDGKFVLALPAQNGCGIVFRYWPDLSCMISRFLMAGIARVIGVAAFEFNGDDVVSGMIMNTSGEFVNGLARNSRRRSA